MRSRSVLGFALGGLMLALTSGSALAEAIDFTVANSFFTDAGVTGTGSNTLQIGNDFLTFTPQGTAGLVYNATVNSVTQATYISGGTTGLNIGGVASVPTYGTFSLVLGAGDIAASFNGATFTLLIQQTEPSVNNDPVVSEAITATINATDTTDLAINFGSPVVFASIYNSGDLPVPTTTYYGIQSVADTAGNGVGLNGAIYLDQGTAVMPQLAPTPAASLGGLALFGLLALAKFRGIFRSV